MPNFVIEVTSKSTFGPFQADSEGQLQHQLVNGNLDLASRLMQEGSGTTLKVKELKEPVQAQLPGGEF